MIVCIIVFYVLCVYCLILTCLALRQIRINCVDMAINLSIHLKLLLTGEGHVSMFLTLNWGQVGTGQGLLWNLCHHKHPWENTFEKLVGRSCAVSYVLHCAVRIKRVHVWDRISRVGFCLSELQGTLSTLVSGGDALFIFFSSPGGRHFVLTKYFCRLWMNFELPIREAMLK